MFSIDGKLDYVTMLLVLCKDNHSITGLIKAISLIINQNIMINELDDFNHVNEIRSIKLPTETIYKTLMICLKNYKVVIFYIFLINKIVLSMHNNRIQAIATLTI